MNKLLTYVCAATMALSGVAMTAAPAIAAPMAPIAQPQTPTTISAEEVQYRRYPRRFRGGFNGPRRGFYRGDFYGPRRSYRDRRGFYRDSDMVYYNGHRGYRSYRPGYRRHNDFWFPAGAFIAGAIIGGALSDPGPYYAPRRVYRRAGGSAHVNWCYNRYRSYRAYDNTFQPYNGPRQLCYSPYN
ncbi:MAG: BA14K family protein [Rhizobiaceae bacterium]